MREALVWVWEYKPPDINRCGAGIQTTPQPASFLEKLLADLEIIEIFIDVTLFLTRYSVGLPWVFVCEI